jgi:hypothetical protein
MLSFDIMKKKHIFWKNTYLYVNSVKVSFLWMFSKYLQPSNEISGTSASLQHIHDDFCMERSMNANSRPRLVCLWCRSESCTCFQCTLPPDHSQTAHLTSITIPQSEISSTNLSPVKCGERLPHWHVHTPEDICQDIHTLVICLKSMRISSRFWG